MMLGCFLGKLFNWIPSTGQPEGRNCLLKKPLLGQLGPPVGFWGPLSEWGTSVWRELPASRRPCGPLYWRQQPTVMQTELFYTNTPGAPKAVLSWWRSSWSTAYLGVFCLVLSAGDGTEALMHTEDTVCP
jgi:hypothetical protein